MRVGVHGVGYAGMAQDLLNNLGVLALFEHKGGEGVPEIVGASGLRQDLVGQLLSAWEVRLGEQLLGQLDIRDVRGCQLIGDEDPVVGTPFGSLKLRFCSVLASVTRCFGSFWTTDRSDNDFFNSLGRF